MSTGKIDFYTKVHKALRASLFQLSQQAATIDYTRKEALDALIDQLRELLAKLSAHASHEARFIHPLLAQKRAGTALDAEHEALEREQAKLPRLLAEAAGAPPDERHPRGLAFYRALNVFIARYLEHLDREEATMPVLWERCGDEELAAVMARFAASRAIDETYADIGWMLPCLSAPERAELLGGLTRTSAGPR